MRKTLILPLIASGTLTFAGCGDFFYGRDLEGQIVSTGSRFKGQNNDGSEKISLIVKATKSDKTIDDVAGGPSGVAIECLSTRCASIIEGTCHRFSCKFDYRINEPDVIACKHDKEIECLKADPRSADGGGKP